jgi:threonine/homoserine/homoserine lactone efflux protein
MDVASLAVFAVALALAAGSPGPSIAALVARVLTGGLGSVLPFLAAMWLGEAMWLMAALLGLGFIAERFHLAFLVLKYAGIAYLLFLAWKMWFAPVDVRPDAIPQDSSPLRMFLTGMALTIGNPKIMVFYLALLPSLLDVNAITTLGMVELLLVAIAVLVVIDMAWALAASWARAKLRSPRAMRVANRVSATAMGGAALALAARSN